MRSFLIAAAAALVAATASQVAASADTTKNTCSFNLTGRFAEVRVDSGQPPQSGSNTSAATIDGTMCGKPFHGAARDVNHFPKFGKVAGVATIFAPLGSITVRFEATATINHNHSATLHGSSNILSGTGIYANASGSGTDLGLQAPNSPITIQHLTGTLNY
jgi:opacity protein-like surface antigen